MGVSLLICGGRLSFSPEADFKNRLANRVGRSEKEVLHDAVCELQG